MKNNHILKRASNRLAWLLTPHFLMRVILLMLIGITLFSINLSYVLDYLDEIHAPSSVVWQIQAASVGFALSWISAALYLLLVLPTTESYSHPFISSHHTHTFLVVVNYTFLLWFLNLAFSVQANAYLLLSLMALAAGAASGLSGKKAVTIIGLTNTVLLIFIQPEASAHYFIFILLAQCMTYLLFRSMLEEFKQRTILNLNIAELNATQHLLKESFERDLRYEIARDLHDELGHWVTLLNTKLGTYLTYSSAPLIEEALAATHQLSHHIRKVSVSLRHSSNLNIKDSLACLTKQVARPKIVLEFGSFDGACSSATADTLFRACQEGITNCVRHSSATVMQIRFNVTPGWLTLEINDNGAEPKQPSQSGYGLIGLQERVNNLRGTFKLDASPKGFTLLIGLPFDANDA